MTRKTTWTLSAELLLLLAMLGCGRALEPVADAKPSVQQKPGTKAPDEAAIEPGADGAKQQALHVLMVTEHNKALKHALDTQIVRSIAEVKFVEPQALTRESCRKALAEDAYALVIFDRCAPEKMPRANTLFIGTLPPSEGWSRGEASEAPHIVAADTNYPLMQWVDMNNVRFANGFSVQPPRGSQILLEADIGPLLAIAPRDGFRDAVLGAEIAGIDDKGQRYHNTDWSIRRSFPIFVLNLIGMAGGDASGVPPQILAKLNKVSTESSVQHHGAGSGVGMRPEEQGTHGYDSRIVSDKPQRGEAMIVGKTSGPNHQNEVRETIDKAKETQKEAVANISPVYRLHVRDYFDSFRR